MQDSENDDSLLVVQVEHLVGEALCERATDTAVHNRKLQWIPRSRPQNSLDGQQKVCAKPMRARLVPVVRFCYISLGLRPDDQLAAHAWSLILRRTASHGEPAVGFL